MRTAYFWVFPLRVGVNSYRNFGKTCRSHLLCGGRLKSRTAGVDNGVKQDTKGLLKDVAAGCWEAVYEIR
jgi:hypothetical protein